MGFSLAGGTFRSCMNQASGRIAGDNPASSLERRLWAAADDFGDGEH
jgi:hypothetical protein